MTFMEELQKAIKEGEINREKRKKGIKTPQKVSLTDKIKGIKGAFSRIKEKTQKDGLKTIWADEKEIIERQVCCTTCTDGTSCPYCGCQIQKSWFLPLGKSELTTEGCPNPNTYPHLKNFPPKNYWKTCSEKTSIIIPARNEKYIQNTIESVLKNATGKIEILVGIDEDCDNFNYHHKDVSVYKKVNPIGRRATINHLVKKSTGNYILICDSHCIFEKGFDTRLKCVCENNIIATCLIDNIDEDTWKPLGNKWLECFSDEDLNFFWGKQKENREKIEEVMIFPRFIYMMTRNTYNKFGGFKEYLGSFANEEIEWSLNVWLTGGKVLARTDTVCSHLFREDMPYQNNDDIEKSKDLLKTIWNSNVKDKHLSINDLINKFGIK